MCPRLRGLPSRLFNRNISKNKCLTLLHDFFLRGVDAVKRPSSCQMGAEDVCALPSIRCIHHSTRGAPPICKPAICNPFPKEPRGSTLHRVSSELQRPQSLRERDQRSGKRSRELSPIFGDGLRVRRRWYWTGGRSSAWY